jgi:serine/threonine-protein kinase
MRQRETIRFRGRVEQVLDEIRLGAKTYQLLERLGSGERERYRAFDRLAGPGGDFRAIHVLPRSAEVEQQLAVLKRLADLRNNNVPFIVEYHAQRDRVYLVVAWVWGRSLKEHLERVRAGREPPLSAFHACRLIRGLAHGLCQLHDAWNVNHGDIKPANLILAPQGKHLSTIDFGTAWLTERACKRTAGDGASGAYTAPELLETQNTPDFRSDQFSLSVVWYELLTGQVPYDGAGGKAGLEDMRAALANTLIPPSRILRRNGNVPQGLWKAMDGAVCRGLALTPNERFPQRRAWLDAFDEIHVEFRQRQKLGGINRRIVEWLTKRLGHK